MIHLGLPSLALPPNICGTRFPAPQTCLGRRVPATQTIIFRVMAVVVQTCHQLPVASGFAHIDTAGKTCLIKLNRLCYDFASGCRQVLAFLRCHTRAPGIMMCIWALWVEAGRGSHRGYTQKKKRNYARQQMPHWQERLLLTSKIYVHGLLLECGTDAQTTKTWRIYCACRRTISLLPDVAVPPLSYFFCCGSIMYTHAPPHIVHGTLFPGCWPVL